MGEVRSIATDDHELVTLLKQHTGITDPDLWAVPHYMWPGLARWVLYGIRPGDFLTAVLENKLVDSYALADDANTECMRAWANIMYNHVPSEARRENMKTWRGILR